MIVVEWVNFTPYTIATANTRVVGAEIANMLKFLEEVYEYKRSYYHLIGHSLGAHIAGYCGKCSHKSYTVRDMRQLKTNQTIIRVILIIFLLEPPQQATDYRAWDGSALSIRRAPSFSTCQRVFAWTEAMQSLLMPYTATSRRRTHS